MKWIPLTQAAQLETINAESKEKKVLIFKHSTRCSISDTALNRVERNWKNENENIIQCYYLDLLENRELSNLIASHYKLKHESPQALIIKDGECVFSQTHSGITLNDLLNF